MAEKPVSSCKLKVFIENSGSMDGYMCPGSELKDAVYGLISDFSSNVDTTETNFLNTTIIPYHGDISSYNQALNSVSFTRAGGERGYSDISEMLNNILSQSDDKTISLFVSDCILALPNGNASKYYVTKQIDICNVFKKHLKKCPSFGVVIMQLESQFDGGYYNLDGTQHLVGNRPYYIWLMGPQDAIGKLLKNSPLSNMKGGGYKNIVSFSTTKDVPYEITNRYGKKKSDESCEATLSSDKKIIKILADFSSTLQDDKYLSDISHYKTLNSGIQVASVMKVNNKNYTHELTVEIDKNSKPTAENITLLWQLPQWVNNTNDDSCVDIKNNMQKTSGIKYLIGGIADAYRDYQILAGIKFTYGK